MNCGSNLGTDLGLGYGGFHLIKCELCGVIFWQGWSPSFNESDHYSSFAYTQPNPITTRRLDVLFHSLGKEIQGRRLLDVGCGYGGAVEAAARAGWDTKGIDLSPTVINRCRSRGLNCEVLDFFDITQGEETYDLIIMSELIEHVPFPREWFLHARSLLSANGMLYMTTPNFSSLGRRILKNDWRVIGGGHIGYYSPKILCKIASDCGLKVVQVETRNPSIGAIRKLFKPGTSPATVLTSDRELDQRVRELSTKHKSLSLVKHLANKGLDATGLGETIVAKFRVS